MNTKRLLELLDKNLNQEQLAKDVAAEVVLPELDKVKAKIESGEIDLIKGTDLDKMVLLGLIDKIKAAIAGEPV